LDEFEALAVGQKEVKTEEIVLEEDGRIEGLMPEVDHEGHVRFLPPFHPASLPFRLSSRCPKHSRQTRRARFIRRPLQLIPRILTFFSTADRVQTHAPDADKPAPSREAPHSAQVAVK
jgi:hypothetical protein